MTDTQQLNLVDYSSRKTPHWYTCSTCAASGVKLWRLSHDTSSSPELWCCDCAAARESIDVTQIDARGTVPFRNHRTDQIGRLFPATPHNDFVETYWGYSSVPHQAGAWWNALPNRCAST